MEARVVGKQLEEWLVDTRQGLSQKALRSTYEHGRDAGLAVTAAAYGSSRHTLHLSLSALQIRPMPTVHVLAAVVSRDDQYLVCRRPPHKRHGNLWEFPGGKLEKGETYHQAAQRELTEELGVTAVSVSDVIFSTMDAGSEFQIDFVRTTIVGDPVCIEHSALQWVATEDLLALALAPSDRRFVEFLQSALASTDAERE